MAEAIEITREIFDYANEERFVDKTLPGINEDVVRKISMSKNEPEWMLKKRLQGLKFFLETKMPIWGPDLSSLNLDEITYYINPDEKSHATKWEDVPEDIRRTFERLGIPEAEKNSLAGAGSQYESITAYHNLKEEWAKKGVIFEDMDEALKKYPELVKEYFMTKCVPINDHKFAMLHTAVWSGGTFIYVPKNIKVNVPLQAYFRMNAKKGGQFEHTLIIVDEGAEVSYIEGCFTKGTLINTNPDIKPIEKIQSGDKVLTHNGNYKTVYFTQARPYNGKLYNIDIYGDSSLTLETTEEHPFLCVRKLSKRDRNKTFSREWIKAKELRKNDYLAIPINKIVESSNYKEFELKKNKRKIKFKVKTDRDFFKLIGYYLAEGSISNDSYLNFSFNEKETDKIKEVERLLSKLFKVKTIRTYHKRNHGTNVVVCSVELARLFGKEFGKGALNKNIPKWVMFEDPKKQKELIYGWFRGDGNYFKNMCKSGFKEAFRIHTISEKLARQGRDVLLRLGIVSFLNRQTKRKGNRKPIWTLGIGGEFMLKFGDIVNIKISNFMNYRKKFSMFHIDNKYAYVPIRNIKTRDVIAEPVYNFGVGDDETYTANGVAVHNCSNPLYKDAFNLHAGCVEIYVKKNARARYTSMESWSKKTFNLNTKRAIVYGNGTIEWINGNTGSHVTMLYPCSVLMEPGARCEAIGIAYAGEGQNQDTGMKVIHLAQNTSSTIVSKSISKDGGITSYRGLLKVVKGAKNVKSKVQCDALMMDNKSKSNTFPTMEVKENENVDIAHEATVGKIGQDQIFYLMSRGLSEEEATKMIVRGFMEPVSKQLPLEYAIEFNRLIELELEGSLG